MAGEITSTIEPGDGGVLTRASAGSLTGPLTLRTRAEAGKVLVEIAYEGSEDWHTVSGSPLSAEYITNGDGDHETLHQMIAQYLSRQIGDLDGDDNVEPASLKGFLDHVRNM